MPLVSHQSSCLVAILFFFLKAADTKMLFGIFLNKSSCGASAALEAASTEESSGGVLSWT